MSTLTPSVTEAKRGNRLTVASLAIIGAAGAVVGVLAAGVAVFLLQRAATKNPEIKQPQKLKQRVKGPPPKLVNWQDVRFGAQAKVLAPEDLDFLRSAMQSGTADLAIALTTLLDVDINDIPTLQDKDMRQETGKLVRPKMSYCLRALGTKHPKKTILHDIALLGLILDSCESKEEVVQYSKQMIQIWKKDPKLAEKYPKVDTELQSIDIHIVQSSECKDPGPDFDAKVEELRKAYVKAYGKDSPERLCGDLRAAQYYFHKQEYRKSAALFELVFTERLKLIGKKEMVNHRNAFTYIVNDYFICLSAGKIKNNKEAPALFRSVVEQLIKLFDAETVIFELLPVAVHFKATYAGIPATIGMIEVLLQVADKHRCWLDASLLKPTYTQLVTYYTLVGNFTEAMKRLEALQEMSGKSWGHLEGDTNNYKASSVLDLFLRRESEYEKAEQFWKASLEELDLQIDGEEPTNPTQARLALFMIELGKLQDKPLDVLKAYEMLVPHELMERYNKDGLYKAWLMIVFPDEKNSEFPPLEPWILKEEDR